MHMQAPPHFQEEPLLPGATGGPRNVGKPEVYLGSVAATGIMLLTTLVS